MCHQFTVPTLSELVQYFKDDLKLPLTKPDFAYPGQDVFPGKIAPILLFKNQELLLQEKSWGYPSLRNGKPLFNARIERFYQQRHSMWDASFARQRCIIVTSGFYEYGKKTYFKDNKKYHEKFLFTTPSQKLTLIAGIYDQDHFAMVTTNPNSIMQPVHDRMPLVLKEGEIRQWLFQNFTSLIDRKDFQLNKRQI